MHVIAMVESYNVHLYNGNIYTDWDMFYIFFVVISHMHACMQILLLVIFDHSLHHTDRIMWSWIIFEFYSYQDSMLLFKTILEWFLNQFFFLVIYKIHLTCCISRTERFSDHLWFIMWLILVKSNVIAFKREV